MSLSDDTATRVDDGPVRKRRSLRSRRPAVLGAVLAVIAVAAVVLVVSAGGGDERPAVRAAGGGPVAGGTLTYALAGTQVSLDPAVAATAVTGLIDRNIFDSLVAQTGPDTFAPWLATKWTVSGDGKTYTFTLREGVTFHDGTPFTAEAVKASLDHVVDPATKSAYAASLIAPYEKSRVVSDHVVEVTLKRPFTPFLQALSVPYLGIQSPAALAKPVADYRPVGTGPFSYVSWEKDKRVTLRKNAGYASPPAGASHEGAAYLDTLVFEFVPEDATRWGALTSGQVQAIAGVPPVNAGKLRSLPGFALNSQETPGLNYNLYLNQTRGPLRDVRVRRALSAAVNVEELVRNIYFGHFPVARNPLSRTTASYDPTAESELASYDPDAARRLLDEAGWTKTDADGYRVKDGKTLTLVWPYWAEGNKEQRDVLAEGIQAQAKQVGIKIERPAVDTGAFVAKYLIGGGYDLVDVSFARPTPDVLRFAFASGNTYAKAGGNVALVDSPQIDRWVEEAAETSDPATADKDYAAVQREVLRQAYVLPLYTPVQLTAFSAKVRGVAFDAQTYPVFHSAWLGD
ncbi:ABC transporter substrate-binding protein [Microbispora hainanensis]|jgi:peptide/nickel transport system substrate-binding protein|uniref:ABC transporter substrate-binding protein n=1 Tax=Microbispora TaxID=2005 RepID=UPI00115C3415|nr:MULTISPECIES: ABC transporter substrate-binding protein [Microbispora]NJP30038.1 ABC transporter substrate-binding protein [Microbispora sp. CL1-1]TQS03271.1 ABC transporter substrate-binding protein [Microbispora sp. SCL1-1]